MGIEPKIDTLGERLVGLFLFLTIEKHQNIRFRVQSIHLIPINTKEVRDFQIILFVEKIHQVNWLVILGHPRHFSILIQSGFK